MIPTFEPKPIMQKLITVAKTLGVFSKVNGYEMRGQPPNGLNLSLIAGQLTGAPSSGLNILSLRWQIDGRVTLPMNYEPQEDIDPKLINGAALYLQALCAGFTLGGLVRMIDVRGSEGDPLSATPGYIEANGKMYRVVNLVIPMIINHKWELQP